MHWLDTEHRYGAVSRALHWSMALLVLLMLCSDWWMEAFEGLGEAAAMPLRQTAGAACLPPGLAVRVWLPDRPFQSAG